MSDPLKRSLYFLIAAFLVLEIYVFVSSFECRITSLDTDKSKDATAELEKAIAENPLNPENYYELAVLKGKANLYDPQIEPLFVKALLLNRFDLKYNLAAAHHHYRTGQKDKALYYYNRSLEIPGPRDTITSSSIYCDIADIYLESGDYKNMNKYLDLARKAEPGHYRPPLLLFKYELLFGGSNLSWSNFDDSFKKYAFLRQINSSFDANFGKELNDLAKELLSKGLWSQTRNIYDRYALISNRIEETLLELDQRFKDYPEVISKIWGDRINISILTPEISLKPSLLNHNQGCRVENLKHYIENGDPVSETVEIEYNNSPGYTDLWYLPLSAAISSSRTSLRIIVSSDADDLSGHIAVELNRLIHYSKGIDKKDGLKRHVVTVTNLLSIASIDLISHDKDYNINLTKAGLNTICRNSKLKFERISLYLED
jgi:tetratricopeptide (TPR) repeat protein